MGAGIPQSEYEERWRKVQAGCGERGLDGAVVWSRGGAMTDGYADVFYLANHYSLFPLTADNPPDWSGRAHAAVVLPAVGEPTLAVEVPDWQRQFVPVSDVRYSLDLPTLVAEVVKEKGLGESRLGLGGASAMLVAPYRRLLAALPGVELELVDDLLQMLRARKSPNELELVREAAAVGNHVVQAIMETALKPGKTEAEAIAAGYAVAAANGVAMYDAAASSGPNSNYYAFGRLPSWTTRVLEAGDLFHVDSYGVLNGYLFDFSRSCVCGGKATPGQEAVLEAIIGAVEAGIAALRPGVEGREVHAAVRGFLEDRGLAGEAGGTEDISATGVQGGYPGFSGHGHGFGLHWEPPWILASEKTEFEAGMSIAIEVMAGRPDVGSGIFEEDVIVTESGTELLTIIPKRYW